MAKKITIAVLALLLVGGALWQNIYINDSTEKMQALLEPVAAALSEKNWNDALASAKILNLEWDKEKRIYGALFDHEELDLISAAALRLNSFCEIRNLEGALSEAASFAYYIKHLKEIDSIRWENIF
ncbi:MAG: DUF4363 family protein [Christensenellales bacterium]